MTPTQLNAIINWLDERFTMMQEIRRQDRGLTPSNAATLLQEIAHLDNELREHFVEPQTPPVP